MQRMTQMAHDCVRRDAAFRTRLDNSGQWATLKLNCHAANDPPRKWRVHRSSQDNAHLVREAVCYRPHRSRACLGLGRKLNTSGARGSQVLGNFAQCRGSRAPIIYRLFPSIERRLVIPITRPRNLAVCYRLCCAMFIRERRTTPPHGESHAIPHHAHRYFAKMFIRLFVCCSRHSIDRSYGSRCYDRIPDVTSSTRNE